MYIRQSTGERKRKKFKWRKNGSDGEGKELHMGKGNNVVWAEYTEDE